MLFLEMSGFLVLCQHCLSIVLAKWSSLSCQKIKRLSRHALCEIQNKLETDTCYATPEENEFRLPAFPRPIIWTQIFFMLFMQSVREQMTTVLSSLSQTFPYLWSSFLCCWGSVMLDIRTRALPLGWFQHHNYTHTHKISFMIQAKHCSLYINSWNAFETLNTTIKPIFLNYVHHLI